MITLPLHEKIGHQDIRINAIIIGAVRTPQETEYGTAEDSDAKPFAVQSVRVSRLPRTTPAAHRLVAVSPRAICDRSVPDIGGGLGVN